MNIKRLLKGIVIAGAAGTLFAASVTGCGGDENTTGSTTASVKCQGINDCKGHSDCSGATNDCKGLNECAGQGYLLVETNEDCTSKGGKVL
ncbi:MAG: hypothetical protein KC503_44145 [Myxococcales bacterium]|nr:hypothetical protein [Myxococcales bacterium]